jgi:hypothetical protein
MVGWLLPPGQALLWKIRADEAPTWITDGDVHGRAFRNDSPGRRVLVHHEADLVWGTPFPIDLADPQANLAQSLSGRCLTASFGPQSEQGRHMSVTGVCPDDLSEPKSPRDQRQGS